MDRSCRKRGEEGSAIVETAIILPLAMALLLGIFTGGSAYTKKIALVDATREGARYGASLEVPSTGLSAWRQAVRQRVVDLSGGDLEAADVCVDLVVPTGADATCGVKDPTGAATDPTATAPARIVKVATASGTELDFVFFTSRPTLSSRIAARYERDAL